MRGNSSSDKPASITLSVLSSRATRNCSLLSSECALEGFAIPPLDPPYPLDPPTLLELLPPGLGRFVPLSSALKLDSPWPLESSPLMTLRRSVAFSWRSGCTPRSYAARDLLVGLKKEGSGDQIHNVSFGIAKYTVDKVIYKV